MPTNFLCLLNTTSIKKNQQRVSERKESIYYASESMNSCDYISLATSASIKCPPTIYASCFSRVEDNSSPRKLAEIALNQRMRSSNTNILVEHVAMSSAITIAACASYILVHSLPSPAKQHREMTNFRVLWTRILI